MDYLNINQKSLIKILSSVIRKKRPDLPRDNNIDWQFIAVEALRHKVIPLVYFYLMQKPEVFISDEIEEKLRREYIIEIAEQEKNYLAFGEILSKLTDSDIPVIALKGLFLRELYHDPWLRSMSDYDVLVKPEDLERIDALMKNMGYKKIKSEEKHYAYIHPVFMKVEFHKTLISEDKYENLNEFEENVWRNVIPFKVCGADVLTLDLTDHAIHIVLHMATHMKSGGFGLRQFCDWILFNETYGRVIDRDKFRCYIKSMGLELFTQVLFITCNRYFDLEVPNEWTAEDEHLYEVADRFMIDVLESGAFGNDSNDRLTANRMLYYNGTGEARTLLQRILVILSLMFPKAEKMDTRFGYAKKNHLLLPFAWLHRFAYMVVRRDIDIYEKTAIFKLKNISEIYNKRSLLLQQLGLIKN